ncbi:MAG: glycosyl transferase family 4 [Devosia sp.]|nr:glycosyl transferase family 4 [Devosia sp.]
MTMLGLAGLCLMTALLSWWLTFWIQKNAVALGLVQHPNYRSSHLVPTPSGGGLGIVCAMLLAAGLLGLVGAVVLLPILVCLMAIAGLGLADDLHDLPAVMRFAVQGVVVAGLIWSGGALPPLALAPGLAISGAILAIVILVAGLWWLNLFNFMDGIDGLAASQAIIILLGFCLIWWTTAETALEAPIVWLALLAASATLGFIQRNWPPARIFMGDAGSNALALIIFAIAMFSLADGRVAYQTWLILVSVFVTDATLTLLRRTARGERPWHAHRRHAYQQLSRIWGHQRVTLVYGAATLFWALPIAVIAQHNAAWAWPLVALAYGPLVWSAAWANAGGRSEAGG